MRFTNLSPVFVDALQLETVGPAGLVFANETDETLPDWLTDALGKPDIEEGAVYARDNQAWIVSGSHVRLYPGDWLVKSEDGELAAMQTSDFAAAYMPASLVEQPATFDDDLRACLNRWSAERTGGNTPDFLLSDFIIATLRALGATILRREAWYGRGSTPAHEAAVEEART